MINKRSYLLELQVRNLLSRTAGISQNTLDAVITGIANRWITSIGVYGVDDKNRCRVVLELEINWAAQSSQVLGLGEKGVIAETVSTKDDPLPEVATVISAFTQTVEAGHLRTEWYCRYEHGFDRLAFNKKLGATFVSPKASELPELKLPFSSFSQAYDPSEYPQALLQHRYALDVLTQSLSNTHGYPTNPPDDNSHLKAEGLPHVTQLRVQAALDRESTHEAEQAKDVRPHVEQLREEAKIPRGVIIYQQGTLPKNYETHAKQFVEALGSQQHRLRQPAEHALQRFAAAAAKDTATDKGILIEQASRKFGIPARTLADWVDMELIPVLSRSKKAVYLDEKAVAEAAPLYREAKERRVQPARLLKEWRAQQRAGNPPESS
jgi:hypothetical protein